MGKPIIEINHLSKCYRLGQFGFSSFREEAEKWMRRTRGLEIAEENVRDFWALRDVSITVQPGEVVGIIGRNGAGKSTLLKILSRITEPTQGEVVLRGRVASLLEVGTGFHPELSGRENVFLNGAILGMRKAEIARKFDEIVDFAEVEQFIDTPVKRYSSGMYVKLAFAVAAHLEPEILIVDEVLAVGDVQFQRKCVAKMGEVSGKGRTVLFVSHNIGLIHALCDKGVCLEAGRVRATGSISEVVLAYNESGNLAVKWAERRNGPIGFVKVVPLDEGESLIRPGAGYRLHFESVDARSPNTDAVVRIRNAGGLVVHYFNSCLDELAPRSGEFPGFCLEVNRCDMPPGQYFVDVELWKNGECIDRVNSATTFEVVDGFFNGRPARAWNGNSATLTEHKWSVS